ncbi:MAG: ABC-2 family transporter protein [bacterium]|nr:ABC-2 family transporter protein [bacterium]
MRKTNKFRKIIVTALKDSSSYPADTLIVFVSGIIFVGIQYFLWQCIYSSRTEIRGFDFKDIISYLALVSVIGTFLGSSFIERSIQSQTMSGTIGSELLFPLSYRKYLIYSCYGRNLFSLFVSGIPLFLLAFFLIGLKVPSLFTVFIFLISLHLGFLIGTNISFIVGITAFSLKNNEGIIQVNKFVSGVFSGGLVPLSFFPVFIKKIASVLPFQGIIFIPIQIYLKKISGVELLKGLGFQIFWVIVLIILGSILFEKLKNKIEIFGG